MKHSTTPPRDRVTTPVPAAPAPTALRRYLEASEAARAALQAQHEALAQLHSLDLADSVPPAPVSDWLDPTPELAAASVRRPALLGMAAPPVPAPASERVRRAVALDRDLEPESTRYRLARGAR